MSTRCQITINNLGLSPEDFLMVSAETQAFPSLYKRWDGYPEATLGALVKFVREFDAARGIGDVPYLLAQVTAFFVGETQKDMKEGSHQNMLGFGIQTEIQSDLDYAYVIDTKAKVIYCMRRDYDSEQGNYHRCAWVVDQAVPLTPTK